MRSPGIDKGKAYDAYDAYGCKGKAGKSMGSDDQYVYHVMLRHLSRAKTKARAKASIQ